MRAADKWEKKKRGVVCKGRASLSCLSPSVCFPEALRSLIIAVKSTAKQLSKGKHRQREREGERGIGGEWGRGGRRRRGVKVGERWKATERRRTGEAMSSLRRENSEVDWGLRKRRDERGLCKWRTWHHTPVCIAQMQIHERERERAIERGREWGGGIKWERRYK